MEKKILTIFLFVITLPSLSQNNGTLISSRILDSLGIVKNANIINLNTNQGTFSSDAGRFQIYAKKGDTLRISSIQHITQKIKITPQIIENKALIIILKPNIV